MPRLRFARKRPAAGKSRKNTTRTASCIWLRPNPEVSYLWLTKNATGRGCRVWGVRGSSTLITYGKLKVGQPLDKTPSGRALPGGLRIISLDTNKLKDTYHYRLGQAIEAGPRAAYLHCKTDRDYALQITAEEKRVDRKRLEAWVQVKKDNLLLDCEVMAMAVAEPECPGGGVNLIQSSIKRRHRRIISKGVE
jgi:phage terminase large subunit GpA-like protein